MNIQRASATRLLGTWLGFGRVAWVVIVMLAVGLYLFSIPPQFAQRQVLCLGIHCPFFGGQLSLSDWQQFQQAGFSLRLYAVYSIAVNAIFIFVFLSVAAIIFWRSSDNGLAIFTSLMLVTFGISFGRPLDALGASYPALLLPAKLLELLGDISIDIFFLIFPDGAFVPRWTRWLVPFMAMYEALDVFAPDLLGAHYEFVVILASCIFAQVYRYLRVSNTLQRQQTKWAVYGIATGVGGLGGTLLLGAWLLPVPSGISAANPIGYIAFFLFPLLIPLSIGMAILRSHLWDIDIIIRRTLIYGALTILLALLFNISSVVVQQLIGNLTGQSSEIAIIVSTLAIAALFNPLRMHVQNVIDRHFYRRKYNAQKVLADFSATVRDEVDLNKLSEDLLAVVEETMQPAGVGLWLKPDQTRSTWHRVKETDK